MLLKKSALKSTANTQPEIEGFEPERSLINFKARALLK
jgi:hypothetical protein